MKKVLFLSILFTQSLLAECIDEMRVSGLELMHKRKKLGHVYIETNQSTFERINEVEINPLQIYNIQVLKHKFDGNFRSYNKRYIEYYRYKRIQDYLAQVKPRLYNVGYEQRIVGNSLEGRNLYVINPVNFDPKKKTIVMFGRHHGDEGTANWIIEGFFNKFLENKNFRDEFQLVLYPMINPDGAEAQSRYNENGRDLNRSWSTDLTRSYDEAKTVHADLKKYLKYKDNIVIVLDMHGSFYKDFIYRVEEDFIHRGFYNHQQQFIDQLARYDQWQNGYFNLSNGHKKMARIVMVKDYGLHALTHETPRDIKLNNNENRTKQNLKEQGIAVLSTIQDLY